MWLGFLVSYVCFVGNNGVLYVANMSSFSRFPIFWFSMLRVCCVFYIASGLHAACVVTDSCVSAEEEIQGSMSKISWDLHAHKVALGIVRLYLFFWVSDVQNVQILVHPLISFQL